MRACSRRGSLISESDDEKREVGGGDVSPSLPFLMRIIIVHAKFAYRTW